MWRLTYWPLKWVTSLPLSFHGPNLAWLCLCLHRARETVYIHTMSLNLLMRIKPPTSDGHCVSNERMHTKVWVKYSHTQTPTAGKRKTVWAKRRIKGSICCFWSFLDSMFDLLRKSCCARNSCVWSFCSARNPRSPWRSWNSRLWEVFPFSMSLRAALGCSRRQPQASSLRHAFQTPTYRLRCCHWGPMETAFLCQESVSIHHREARYLGGYQWLRRHESPKTGLCLCELSN